MSLVSNLKPTYRIFGRGNEKLQASGRSLRMKHATVALLWIVLAGCASSGAGFAPLGHYSELARVAPAHKKAIVYRDALGDALPMGITRGPDGAIWFTDAGNSVIGRIDKDGNYTMQSDVGAVPSNGIVTGPDQNLWFTVGQTEIGQITTAGVVTLFQDTGGSDPQGITVGTDGALWFAESNGTVGRMTTSGSVKHFTVAASNVQLEGIVTGPDGNLWVTQFVVGSTHFSNKVIRLTPQGKKRTFTVGSGPDEICVGPDRALWFTQKDAYSIGRLTTSGAYHSFSVGNRYVEPAGIAVAPDGTIWFTDFSGIAGVGHMTLKGTIAFVSVPGSDPEVQEIVAGPKESMWFSIDLGPSGIGRVRF